MEPDTLALLIPIVAIVMGIGIAMLTIYLGYLKRRQVVTLYHQERMAAIEKGLEVPPLPEALLAEDSTPYNPRRHLLKGLVWLFIGLSLGIAVFAVASIGKALFGLIPAGIGLAHLIYYFAEGRKEAETLEQNRTRPEHA